MTAETASEEITLPTNEYNSLGTKMASEEITELLPCPFCGNAPLVDNCGEGGSSIRCRTFMCPLDDIEVSDDTIEDVTKRWNRRDDRHAQGAPWQPIDTIPQDRPIDGWHKVWKCPVTIAYRSWGDRNAWVEKTLTTEWPIEAFTHWRETSEAPALTPTERCDGADDLEHLDGMLDDRERG